MAARRYTPVSQVLRHGGPQLSSAVALQLIREGASPSNARKLIQRSFPEIKRLSEITFPHRERFLYLPEQHDTPPFWESLFLAFRSTNSVYGHAIDALRIRGGSVPGEYFGIISGSPIKLRGHLSVDRVREALQRLGVLNVTPHPEWASVITLKPHVPGVHGLGMSRARMLAEDIAADATMNFLQRTGLGSYGKVKVRNFIEAPTFGAFKWDITAPCYVSPLRRYAKGQKGFQNGFLVADVLLGAELGLEHVKPFLMKTEIMRSNPKTALFLSLLIADKFSKEALRAGKAVGHLMLTTETLFTREIAEALKALIEVLTKAATAAADYPELVYDLFDQLSSIEGSASSMQGPLFELWLARYLFLDGWSIRGIGHRMKVWETGETVEVDVLVDQANGMRIRACEAKAHASLVSLGEIKDWITRQIPRIKAALLQNRDGRTPDLVFEFWTTSSFSPEALEFLETAARRTKAYGIKWFDRTQLPTFAEKAGDTYLPKILNDFFLRNSTSARLLQMQRRRSQLAHLSSRKMSQSEVQVPLKVENQEGFAESDFADVIQFGSDLN